MGRIIFTLISAAVLAISAVNVDYVDYASYGGFVEVDVHRVEEGRERLQIGITHAHFDDVGQILRFFGGGIDLHVLSANDFNNIDRLNQFYAVFINCGGDGHVNPRILQTYVAQGGVVYASDLASGTLISAFSDVFEAASVDSPMTVRAAGIPHVSLAAHMGTDQLDVVFNMAGWHVLTDLHEDATIYIEGYVPNHGTSPLAMSFTHGEGTVFYTSFHNNAQATGDMINFIEYLVFRIKFIEADRAMTIMAEREGFASQGQVFGFFAGSPVAQAMSPVSDEMALGLFDAESPSIQASTPPAAAPVPQTFQFTFAQNENFMLMVEAGGQNFTMRLYDPLGNIFYISQDGGLISQEATAQSTMMPVFEGIDGHGVRVSNVVGGEWRFTIIAEDAAADAVFAVGIATQAP